MIQTAAAWEGREGSDCRKKWVWSRAPPTYLGLAMLTLGGARSPFRAVQLFRAVLQHLPCFGFTRSLACSSRKVALLPMNCIPGGYTCFVSVLVWTWGGGS